MWKSCDVQQLFKNQFQFLLCPFVGAKTKRWTKYIELLFLRLYYQYNCKFKTDYKIDGLHLHLHFIIAYNFLFSALKIIIYFFTYGLRKIIRRVASGPRLSKAANASRICSFAAITSSAWGWTPVPSSSTRNRYTKHLYLKGCSLLTTTKKIYKKIN